MSSPRSTSDRLVLLDAWRIVAVGLVVATHLLQRRYLPAGDPFGIQDFYWVTLGGVGVTLLIILSGLCLELSYGPRGRSWFTFMRRRARRIYPMYWMSIALAIVLVDPVRTTHATPTSVFGWILDLSGFLTFTGRSWSGYILPTGWFIGLIMVLYALYPAISKAMRDHPAVTLAVLLAISVASRLFVCGYLPGPRALDWFPLARVFEFGLGIWIARTPRVIGSIATLGRNAPTKVVGLMEHAGAVSFPVYLIHYAVLRWGPLQSLEPMLFVPVALAGTVFIAVVLTKADRIVQKAMGPAQAKASDTA